MKRLLSWLPVIIVIGYALYRLSLIWTPYIASDIQHDKCFDFRAYQGMAQNLRGHGFNPEYWYIFPPGFSFLLALLPLPAHFVTFLLFLLSVVLLYRLILPKGILPASFAIFVWAGYCLTASTLAWLPWSEMAFVCYLLAALLLKRYWAKGLLTALAFLTRPEGLIALPFLFWKAKECKLRFQLLAAFALLAIPYWIFLHVAFGGWQIIAPGKSEGIKLNAPYLAAGLTWHKFPEIKVNTPFGIQAMNPMSPELSKYLPPDKVAEVRRMTHTLPRLLRNLSTGYQLLTASHVYTALLLLSLAGLLCMIVFRRSADWFHLALFSIMFAPAALNFLESERFFICLFLALSVCVSGLGIAIQLVLSRFAKQQSAVRGRPVLVFSAVSPKQ
jgi:hypothetical protein